jgi:hypothetical protein
MDEFLNSDEKILFLITLLILSFIWIIISFLSLYSHNQLKLVENLIFQNLIIKDCLNTEIMERSKPLNIDPRGILYFHIINKFSKQKYKEIKMIRPTRRYSI